MVRAHHTKSAQCDVLEGPQPCCEDGGTCFTWSLAKIRIACLVLLGAATPAIAGFGVSVPFVQWLCLAWLVGVALLTHGLNQRASADTIVLSVDRRGILDRRLMSRHIKWQEIEAIWPVNTDRSHAIHIQLRWPKTS